MKTIKWGIIGTGIIASTFAEALNSLDNSELTGVASRGMERARNFADRFHIRKAYDSYEDLAKDAEIDVVYIATPHTEHKDNAALCMKYGKAVLCEKPITLNQKETQYLIDTAKENNVFLMEAMWTKFLPATNIIKKWLADKAIGDIRCIKADFGYRSEYDMNHRLFNPKLAGGALLDVGIYPITYTVHLMEKLPDEIISRAVLGKSGVDDINAIVFGYRNGAIAELSSSVAVEMGRDAVILGDNGRIFVPNFWMADRAERYDAKGKLVETFSEPFAVNGYVYEAEEVNRCLREGKKESTVVPLKYTMEIMKLMDSLRKDWGLTYPQE